MGNIIVSRETMTLLNKEAREASNLMSMTPYNEKEEQFIEKVKWESMSKVFLAFGLSLVFCASFTRYFQDTIFVKHKYMIPVTFMSIVIPSITLVNIQVNREIIQDLKGIKRNHDLMEKD